jgi:hypothetical protein
MAVDRVDEEIKLLVTDKNLVVQGDPLDGWTDLSSTLNDNQPGSGQVTLPAYPEVMEQLQPGNRLVVIDQGEIWSAGPMEIPEDYSWGVGGDVNQPDPGQVVVNFSDDLARVAGYLTYPDPTKTFANQVTATDDVYALTATNAEVIIRALVNLNCGPGAIAGRRIEKLVLGALAGVGSNTSISTRFEDLLDPCRTVASGDGLSFRTRQVGNQIVFEVYAPADRTGTARFSAGLGNLRSVSFKMSAPTATQELVQGGDTGARVYVEVSSGAAADWYRVEKLVDQSGTANDANGELTQAGNLALGDDNPQVTLSTVTVDVPDAPGEPGSGMIAGRDFGLSDLVTVVLPTGVEVADKVRSITKAASPGAGKLVTSVIGSQDATTNSATVKTIRDLARRLGRMEAR